MEKGGGEAGAEGTSKAGWEQRGQEAEEEKKTIDKDASPFGVVGSTGGNLRRKHKEEEIKGKKKLNKACNKAMEKTKGKKKCKQSKKQWHKQGEKPAGGLQNVMCLSWVGGCMHLSQQHGPSLALVPHLSPGTHQLPGASGADSWASSCLFSPAYSDWPVS